MAKRVTVHYRKLIDRNFADLDFRACYDAGLDGRIGGVRLRDEDAARIATSRDGHRMCLLSPETNVRYCFGEVAVFKDGDVPVAEMDPHGQVLLRTIPLAGNEEAIRGSSYFMARGPHVALLHHDSSTRFVEDYLQWLLRQPLGNLAADELVGLQPLINAGGRPVALRQVKSLKVRAEVEEHPEMAAAPAADGGRHQTFRRLIERQPLTGANARSILHALGMTDGTLRDVSDADLRDLEFELVVKKREHNRITPLPDELVQGVLHDGLDRAAEFETMGARRRGDGVVASFAGEVDVRGAYYDLNSVRSLLWDALGEWTNQGLI